MGVACVATSVSGNMVRKVLVTRPQREAQAWVQALRDRGHPTCALPLIDISPVPDQARLRECWQGLLATPGAYRALMFVSAAAVEGFFSCQPSPGGFGGGDEPQGFPRCWATGPGTRRALLAAGIAASSIDAPSEAGGQFDSEALWARVGSSVRHGDRVLVVRGGEASVEPASHPDRPDAGVGRDWLAGRLRDSGAEVHVVVSYLRAAPNWSAAQIATARDAAADGSIWLFSSSQAIAHLRALLPDLDWSGALAITTHPRIELAAKRAGFGRVFAARPVMEELIASIESVHDDRPTP